MTANQTRAADETAIRNVLKGVYEAWNASDADAFVADYTEDASAILPGSYRKSREEIRESMKVGFSTFLKGSTTTDKVLNIRFLNDDAAWSSARRASSSRAKPRCRETALWSRAGCLSGRTASGCLRPTRTPRRS
ncbi:SgcJ/EcaC family oxidoreductase [Streptomyces mirabilis]|uniref:SgcJ/EcaC family oxidoreductase n=1 Tax=Streptomyces mirabilis TaxID=68239 RepID=UPI0033B95342